MCFDFGGGGSQTQVQRSEPWAEQKPYLIEGFERAGPYVLDRPLEYFPGSTVVPFAPESELAMGLTAARGAGGSPLIDTGTGELGRTISGEYFGASPAYDILEPFGQGGVANPAIEYLEPTARGDFLSVENPYFSDVVESVYNEVRPRVDTQFEAGGRYGSGAHRGMMTKALGDITADLAYRNYQDERGRQLGAAGTIGGLSEGDIARRFAAGQVLGDVYGQERGRQLGATELAPRYAAQDYLDFAALGGVGAQREAKSAEELADEMARWEFAQREPTGRLADYMGLVSGGYGGTSTSTVRQDAGNPLLGLLGTAATVASLGGPMGFGWWGG